MGISPLPPFSSLSCEYFGLYIPSLAPAVTTTSVSASRVLLKRGLYDFANAYSE